MAVPELRDGSPPFRARYGPAATAASLDEAGAAQRSFLHALVEVAESDLAVRSLRGGLARTARRVNALEKIILPQLSAEIRAIRDAVEEEERDEALRRSRRAGAPPFA